MVDFLWYLALVIDIIHIPIVIFILIFSKRVFGAYGAAAPCLMVSSQLACLGCPLTVLSGWLRSFKDPNVDVNKTSITHWAYSHLGFWANLHWALCSLFVLLAVFMVKEAKRDERHIKALQ
jgi:hypothetical protein